MADRVVHLAVPFEPRTFCGDGGDRTLDEGRVTCQRCRDEFERQVYAQERAVEEGQRDWSEGRRR